MTSVPPKAPPEESNFEPSEAGADVSGAPQTRTLLMWLAVIGVMVSGLWWLSSDEEPSLDADPAAASDRGFGQDRADPAQRMDLTRHLTKRRGPHLFDEKRPNWDPARLRARPGVGLTRPKLADASPP